MTSELSITFRKGKPLVAYLALVRLGERKVVKTELLRPGVVVDLGASGEPVGVEFTEPSLVTQADIAAVVERLHAPNSLARDLQPLIAA